MQDRARNAQGPDAPIQAAGRCFFSGTERRAVFVDRIPAPDNMPRRHPIVMVHGGCHTGTCYLATPDGRAGWAEIFATAGHDVFVVDWPGHGRSPVCEDLAVLPTREIAEALLALIKSIGPAILLVHSASGPMAWWMAEQAPEAIVAILGIAPGAPANILPVLPNDAAEVAKLSHDISLGCPVLLPEDKPVQVGAEFIATYWANAPRFPKGALAQYRQSIVPESARLFNERFNIGGQGLCINDPASLAKLPILIVTGDHDPRHPREIDQATATFLGAEFLWLPDIGIKGNGHMPMIEDNSDTIAALLLNWLGEKNL
ncbi:MAG: alpha/beta hydrolase [Rhizobiales bacterium PAR1]|nr:MAG: alpha/beta hydrolase [Rhizobiales bacterium PAR1]